MSLNLSKDYQLTHINQGKLIRNGLDAWMVKQAGRFKQKQKVPSEFHTLVKEVGAKKEHWKNVSDDDLKNSLQEFKTIFRRQGQNSEEHLVMALAAIREASTRILSLWPYDVQLIGALAMLRGYLAEMATGEGKTLTAALTGVIWGWTGKPCHVITVNDYLAERDAQWLMPFYEFCGVSVGCVTGGMEPDNRRAGYQKDVTYTTSKEIVADFLRDRLWLGKLQNSSRRLIAQIARGEEKVNQQLVMRGIHSAIVDEADSILIDEAVIPLIISRPQPNEPFVEACKSAFETASALKKKCPLQNKRTI